MINNNDKTYSVYKGLQRPIQFKGLKGNYIYFAFGIAICSLFVMMIASTMFNFMTGAISMAVFLFGGIIGMALYQRKYGLYQKNVKRGVYIIYKMFSAI